jgi:PAS domain S-box-containing protein
LRARLRALHWINSNPNEARTLLARLVTEHILDAIFILDIEGHLIFGNRRGEELTGYPAADLIGRSIAELLTPEGAREAATRMQAVRTGHEVESLFETQLVRKDGTMIWVEASLTTLVEHGRPVARLGVARDITRRRVAEAALRESEERFRAMFEQADVGIAFTGDDGRFLRVNPRLCDMLGYTPEELQRSRVQDVTHPDDRELNVHLRQPLSPGAPSFTTQTRCLRRDGTIMWVTLTVSMARAEPGQPSYAIAIIQDITAQKQLERELLHAQRMDGVGQLAGGMAHDFNNVLTVISGRCHLILSRMAPADPLRRDLEVIQKTSERAASLTRQLLAFSRKQVLRPRVVDFNDLARQATSLLTRLLGENLELSFVPAADAGRVRVDPAQLEQIIVNLAVNARDAMPEGGRLTIETAVVELDSDATARPAALPPGTYALLTVSDNGAGMDSATRARIFEPFFTTKPPGKGTGLGLSTVYGIVKQSGGHISVDSVPGVGTTFRIYLPQTGAQLGDAAGREAGVPSSGTETILLVEDEPELRTVTSDVLERLGYTVLKAALPSEALFIAERYPGPIDLLVTDVIMPRMDGRTLAATIAPMRPETRMLFISGYMGETIVQQGVLEPGCELLEKPFTPRVFAAKVREVLDRAQ